MGLCGLDFHEICGFGRVYLVASFVFLLAFDLGLVRLINPFGGLDIRELTLQSFGVFSGFEFSVLGLGVVLPHG